MCKADRLDPSAIFNPMTYATGVPYELLAALRRSQGVIFMDEPAVLGWPAGPGFFAVLRHKDAKAVLRDHSSFSSALAGTQIRDYETEEDLAEVRHQILNMDPPQHNRMRKLFAQAFTPPAVAKLEATIEQNAIGIVHSMREREEFDFVKLVADLPLLILAELLGVPASDRYLMYDWSNRVIGYQDPEYKMSAAFDIEGGSEMARKALASRPAPAPDGTVPNPRTRAGIMDLYEYAREMASYKRAHPGPDVMSLLLQAEDDQGGLTDEEFENLCWLFFVAGNETLRNGLAGGMLTLLEHPNAYEQLRKEPARTSRAVEEMLRYWPPVMHFRRTATKETAIDGMKIRRGNKVVVWHVSANRDEDVFDEPERFDIDRNPNDHVSFGFGVHFCLGAHLARAQMRYLFYHIVADLPPLQAAGTPVRLISNFQNGLKSLPVSISQGRAS
ncbi:MAG: cytochrome P450 [Actinobacteria bacterium]|nr:cytochrome P450 [Actinomycetota bacterium]